MLSPDTPLTAQALVDDLKLLRQKGLVELAGLDLPALREAARAVAAGAAVDDHALIENVLRTAVAHLGGGNYGEAAAALFGLDQGGRTLTAGFRRGRAAGLLGISVTTLRKKHEKEMLGQVAAQLMAMTAEQRMRDGRLQPGERHPADSAIALHWIERFQAYYRLWTPIYGLANDLVACRSTLLEEPRPYDRRFGTKRPDDEGYSQEEQAEGYATFALYHYTLFEWELRRFRTLYGGLWLLSDAQAETDVADAIHRISWHVNPFNERDQSFLRTVLDEVPSQELHGFISGLAATEIGQTTHREWQDWVATRSCSADPEGDYFFSTAEDNAGISAACQVHAVIAACGDYCRLIDEDWLKIADWYHLPADIKRGMSDEQRYREWRGHARRSPPIEYETDLRGRGEPNPLVRTGPPTRRQSLAETHPGHEGDASQS